MAKKQGAARAARSGSRPGAHAAAQSRTTARSRAISAAMACGFSLLVYLVTWRGYFVWMPAMQVSIVGGAVAGLFAEQWADAAVAAFVALLVGWLVTPPVSLYGTPLTQADVGPMLAFALGGAAVAGALAWAVRGWGGSVVVGATTLVVVALVVNLWATTWVVGHTVQTATASDGSLVTMATWLDTRPAVGQQWTDDEAYLYEYHLMRAGTPYYAASSATWLANTRWKALPGSVFEVRPPAVFWLWQLVGAQSSWGIITALLVVCSAAMGAVALFSASMLKAPFAIVGAALSGAYWLYFTTGTPLAYADVWGSVFAVLGICALGAAALRARWVALFALGVVAVTFSAWLREFYLIMPVAGALATLGTHAERRRTQLIAWGVSAVAIVAYYAVHLVNAVAEAKGPSVQNWLRPGLTNLTSALTYATAYLGPAEWLAIALVIVGLLGVVLAPNGGVRWMLLVSVFVPLVFFTIFRNDAVSETGAPLNYWGVAVVPLALACVPLVFSLVPGASRPGVFPELHDRLTLKFPMERNA